MPKILRKIEKEINRIYDLQLNLNEFNIEVKLVDAIEMGLNNEDEKDKVIYNKYVNTFKKKFGEGGIVKATNYLGSENASREEMEAPHTMNIFQKQNSKQLNAFKRNRAEYDGKRHGKISKAEYNFNRRIGESKDIITEIEVEDINLKSFNVKNELYGGLWDNFKLKSEVRKKLLDIVDDFMGELKVNPKFWVDTLLLGSLAGYN